MLSAENLYIKVINKYKALYHRREMEQLKVIIAKSSQGKFWSRIKNKNHSSDSENIGTSKFFTYFSGISNVNIDGDVHNSATNVTHDEELDNPITDIEVIKAIESLKRGKSSGLDYLINEMFIDANGVLTPYLTKLFNHMFENNIYPDKWTKSVIIPIPKKGDLSDVNNYRGITIMSVFAKIFSIVLNNRLMKWAESSGILNDCQYGFRENKGTIDCIFILQNLINRSCFWQQTILYFCRFQKSV